MAGLNYFQERELKADINISTSGDNTIIAPGSGQMPATWDNSAEFIAIDFIVLFATAAVTVQMKDGTTNYGGAYPLAAQQAYVFDNTPHLENGIITLSANSNFVINLSAPVSVTGFIRYRRKQSN
jgi:hypothetical protein